MKKAGSGGRKYGRNKVKCQRYREQNRRFHNKLRRLKKRIKHLSNELQRRILRLNPIREFNTYNPNRREVRG